MVLHRRAYRVIILIGVLVLSMQLVGSAPSQAQDSTATPIESDDSQVLRTGTWASQSAAASGGSYLYSSGAAEDALTLQIFGSSIEVMYVAGPSLGTLAIDVDGTMLRTVITTADQTAYAQAARVENLTDAAHTLKVYAQEGVVAVDAFVIPPTPSDETSLTSSEGDGGAQSSTCAPLHAVHRVSITDTGQEGELNSRFASISGDGRYVAFMSDATLDVQDHDLFSDIYVYDRYTCTLRLVSVNSAGQKGNNSSVIPAISGDGRYILFNSSATNLVAGDTNGFSDAFVYDQQTGTTTRVSVATGGAQAIGGHVIDLAISANGRFVTFGSGATNLVATDTNAQSDIFVHDRQTGTTSRVSVTTGEAQANSSSSLPAISADGRFVTFTSFATNLVAGDTNAQADVFVYDRQTGTISRVSVATGGPQANNASFDPAISANGRFVAFISRATNLVAGDTNAQDDIFVHDRQTGITSRVSVASGGPQATGGDSFGPAISADGRFVVFASSATNLVAGINDGTQNIFVHDRQTGMTTLLSTPLNSAVPHGSSIDPAISADGQYVAFESESFNMIEGDGNQQRDIFVAPVQLPSRDALAAFSPFYNYVSLVNTLADNPPYTAFTGFSAYAPVSGGQWVMGDWNADGLDTPGVYLNGVFYFTNVSGESAPTDWGGFWIGVNGPAVAGRFVAPNSFTVLTNDCIGVVDSAPSSGATYFAVYYTCDMSGATATPTLSTQWMGAPLPNPIFAGTHQFMAGDFNGDGVDSIAVRRNEFVAFTNVVPSAGHAAFDLAQYFGTPGAGDNGLFVVGDWDGNGADSFGLFYQNGELFYRNDLDWNSGVYFNQSIGRPFGVGVQVATWH